MDALTIIGLVLGAGAVWYAMFAGNILNLLFDLPSLVLVVGGTIASTIMTYPWEIIKRVPRSLWLTVFPSRSQEPLELIERIQSLAELAILRGVDELPGHLSDDDDEFLKTGVRMLINDWDEGVIRQSMEQEINALIDRHQQVQKVFVSVGGYAPVYGLLGTLVGVLGLLRYLGDPAAMGAAMTTAIVTTFYGIFIANFLALPVAGKLEAYSAAELLNKQMILEGIVAIKAEQAPFMIKERLEKHLALSGRQAA